MIARTALVTLSLIWAAHFTTPTPLKPAPMSPAVQSGLKDIPTRVAQKRAVLTALDCNLNRWVGCAGFHWSIVRRALPHFQSRL